MTTLEQYLAENPEVAPKKGGGPKGEHVLQIACKQWLSEALPPAVMWTAVDKALPMSGADRHRAMMIMARLKARGVKNGVLDFHFWWHGIYLAVELKVGKNTPTDDEDDWITGLRREGFRAEVAWSAAQLEHWLRDAGFPVRTSSKGIDERLPLREPPKRSRPSKPRQERPSSRAVAIGNRSQRP